MQLDPSPIFRRRLRLQLYVELIHRYRLRHKLVGGNWELIEIPPPFVRIEFVLAQAYGSFLGTAHASISLRDPPTGTLLADNAAARDHAQRIIRELKESGATTIPV